MKTIVLLAFLASVTSQGTDFFCTTPDGVQGMCVGIRTCVPLIALLRKIKDNPNEEAISFLKKSQCGRRESGPTVCCPWSGESSFNRNFFTMPDSTTLQSTTSGDLENLIGIPSIEECGGPSETKNRIVNGAPSVHGAWPWMVALGFKTRFTDEVLWECGGTLITALHVVTAAHCVKHPGMTLEVIRLGELNLDPMVDDKATPQDIRVTKARVHSGYEASGSHPNDVAILVLERPVTFSKYIRPICLPLSQDLRMSSFESKYPFIAGWGALRYKGPKPYALREAQVRVVSNSNCTNSYRRFQEVQITKQQICAGGGSKDTCQGDSGGPLMFPKNGLFYLIGIVSSGYHCAEEGYPGVYTRVTEYVDWIVDNVRPEFTTKKPTSFLL